MSCCHFYPTQDRYVLLLDPNSTMAEIQRFVGLMGVFKAEGGVDPLRFELTPKRGVKARLLFVSNFTVLRSDKHHRFTHPTTGLKALRLSEALTLGKSLQGVPQGEKLTPKTKF